MGNRSSDTLHSGCLNHETDSIAQGSVLSTDFNSCLDIRRPSTFLFSMSSDAMEKDGILPGDIVICRRDLVPEDGDIILAAIGGRFFVRFFCDGNDPVLTCSSDKYQDIHISALKDFELFGVVSSIIRKPKRFRKK